MTLPPWCVKETNNERVEIKSLSTAKAQQLMIAPVIAYMASYIREFGVNEVLKQLYATGKKLVTYPP